MLEVKNISAGYADNAVFDGVSVSFEKGKLTSIVGVNGCGKSTLLKAMLGILPLFGGKIFVDGNDLGVMKRNEIAGKIAYLSQGKNTPDMTVGQMVLHGRFPYLSYPRRYRDEDREMAKRAMREVGILHLAHQPLHTLSGGMRQNAYIAMALAQDTDYILLDEPTTYLDIAHQLDLMSLLRGLADMGKGVVTVMHDLPLAFRFSDEIALIADKSAIIKDTPDRMSVSPILKKTFGVDLARVKGEAPYYYVIQ